MGNQLFASFFLLISILACNSSANYPQTCTCNSTFTIDKAPGMKMALLASRINSMEELQEIIEINYYNNFNRDTSHRDTESLVRLKHCSNGLEIISELKAGISQSDILNARNGSLTDQLALLYDSPFAIANRMEINKVYLLARIKPDLFGEGDVAFYDLALASVKNINTKDLAYIHPRDSSEKGFLNTFNHITAQAFITSYFSENLADFVADVHELHNMPELTSGRFTAEQLNAPDDNPVDNYVDMINNEWGQELGKLLKKRYFINRNTTWTPKLLARYMNDIQYYYSWALQIGFKPFTEEDVEVIRFSKKINLIQEGVPMVNS
ncbi:MAG: hypothetical protein HOL28_12365 [Crocinitomicaceae bacterium]|nr:hypothetical protein [Crocinitomicaceae bacterium]MBT5404233.1 hypothetical protein [Crocinitomicaceae bacterium]MBT6515925.1 hypothetical protein [Crocinitomicaceae bacterium]